MTYWQQIACKDRMCGADDCPNCRPWNFDEDGEWIDPDAIDEEDDDC